MGYPTPFRDSCLARIRGGGARGTRSRTLSCLSRNASSSGRAGFGMPPPFYLHGSRRSLSPLNVRGVASVGTSSALVVPLRMTYEKSRWLRSWSVDAAIRGSDDKIWRQTRRATGGRRPSFPPSPALPVPDLPPFSDTDFFIFSRPLDTVASFGPSTLPQKPIKSPATTRIPRSPLSSRSHVPDPQFLRGLRHAAGGHPRPACGLCVR